MLIKIHTNWCDEGRLVLLCSQHENGEDKLGREKDLDEEALDDTSAARESRVDGERAWEKTTNYGSRGHATKYLRSEEENSTNDWKSTNHP